MAAEKHTTDPAQLDLVFGPQEEWRPILGYEGLYEVSNLGRVRSLDRRVRSPIIAGGWKIHKGRILKPGRSLYLTVRLSREGICTQVSIHVLVLSAFVGRKPVGFVANHLDGNKYNNVPDNLEWVSYSGNMAHAIEKKLHPIGEQAYNAKLTEENIREIRSLAAQGMTTRVLAIKFGVAQSNIRGIVRREYWKHVQ